MSYCNSAAQMRQLTQTHDVFARALENALARDAYWKANFHDEPDRLSGWGHNFVCPHCASQMKLEYVYTPGGEYTCPNCGHKGSGRLLDEAWVYYYRYNSAHELLCSAVAYQLNGDASSLDYVTRYVDFYARHYADFPVHGEYAGKGKVMGQSLDEAVWALCVLCALKVCGREHFPKETLDRWLETMFRPMAALIQSQADRIHNIPLWLQCGAGAIALFFEDDALLESALEGEFGIRNQAKQGYTADGIWYECSLHYHYYATQALTEFLCMYQEKRPDDELFDLLRKAYQAPAQLSPDGWFVPSINDGWYPMGIGTYSRQIMYAHRIVPTPHTGAQLSEVLRREPKQFENAAALVFMRGESLQSESPERPDVCLFPATCLAVLNKPMHVMLKSGVLTTSHMHPDCMSIAIAPFAEDLGTPGYGHPLTSTYYRHTLCHNTFVMDGVSQPHRPVIGSVEAVVGGVRAHAENVYDGVNVTRTLTDEGGVLRDVMHIHADAAHQFDWVFRAAGEAELPAGGVADAFPGNEAPYEKLGDIRRYPDARTFAVRYTLGGQTLTVRIAPETLEKVSVYTAVMPGNPADQQLTAILLRTTGDDVCVEATYEKR